MADGLPLLLPGKEKSPVGEDRGRAGQDDADEIRKAGNAELLPRGFAKREDRQGL